MRKIPFSSTTATKLLIALTGLGLYFYLIIHLAGNLVVLLGKESFNNYAHVLGGNPVIPVIEIGLLLVFLLHVYKTVANFAANQAKRPVGYVRKVPAGGRSKKSLASTTMIVSGTILLIFIVLHLAYFKFTPLDVAPGTQHVKDLHEHEMALFRQPLMVGFYVLSMVIVGFHLWHGFWSAFQSLGLGYSKYARGIQIVGQFLAYVLAGGFIFIPLWVYFVGSKP